VNEPVRLVGFAAGLLIVAVTAASVFTTLVIPRTTSSRLLRSISKVLAKGLRPLLRVLPSYEAKDRVMALVGPLGMVLLFVAWLVSLVFGFGLAIWWGSRAPLDSALAVSGSSVFTLGVAAGRVGSTETLEFIAGGMGLLVIALEIAYLPTLYSAFSSRETEVTLLASRAGRPAWGPEVLTRHQRFGTMSELPELYVTWERWAAAVSETHTSYPSLMWFRSPDPSRSWLLALLAMLDAAALHDSLCPSSAPRQARIYLAMGTGCLRSLAQALRIPFDPDPRPTAALRLTEEEFLAGVERLAQVDFPFERTPEEAWRHFTGWRINYEAIADALTHLIVPPPAPWLPSRPELGDPPWPLVVDRTPDDPEPGATVA
jgi:hypothetical protein